ncbi:MAG: LptE family protein [Bacteroidota bacterium]
MKQFRSYGLICIVILSSWSCTATFNFTGTPKGGGGVDLETLVVDVFVNEAPLVVPFLAQFLTDELQERFLNQSRLNLTTGNADVELSGSITRYNVQPLAITGDETAAQSRLTIGVKVIFTNNVDPNDSWEQTFSQYVDFDAEQDFASIEETLIEEVVEQLTQDIFSKSLGKW